MSGMSVNMAHTIDLIFLEQGGERTLSVALKDKMLGPVPFKNAFDPLSELLREFSPEEFADKTQTQLMLTAIHFRNMSRGENSAGQSYPFRLGFARLSLSAREWLGSRQSFCAELRDCARLVHLVNEAAEINHTKKTTRSREGESL
jgi:hypothetical protein